VTQVLQYKHKTSIILGSLNIGQLLQSLLSGFVVVFTGAIDGNRLGRGIKRGLQMAVACIIRRLEENESHIIDDASQLISTFAADPEASMNPKNLDFIASKPSVFQSHWVYSDNHHARVH
jgi:hypothetical protein